MKHVLFLAIAVMSLSSCRKNDDNGVKGVLKGAEVSIHGGKSWSWIQVNKSGNPERIGITLTDDVLSSVPVGGAQPGHDHGGDNSWVVKFNNRGSIIPFDFVGVNWNPNGHEPEAIYGKPHFDFHFYIPSPEEVAAIPMYEQDSLKFKNAPGAEYFPAAYVNFGGGVPQMGAHWLDVTSPELNGQPFTQTFIYGSYDGAVTFYEPMITLDFLKSSVNYQRPIPQPAKVQKSGWYPTVMKVSKHDKLTEIILDSFVYRQQS